MRNDKKQTRKKLTLNRESLRRLSAKELGDINGGITEGNGTAVTTSCDCTKVKV
jgi:hypothetical protein